MELGLEPSTSVTVDEALTGSVGEFGRGQRLMYTVVCSAWIGSGLLTMVRWPRGWSQCESLVWFRGVGTNVQALYGVGVEVK